MLKGIMLMSPERQEGKKGEETVRLVALSFDVPKEERET